MRGFFPSLMDMLDRGVASKFWQSLVLDGSHYRREYHYHHYHQRPVYTFYHTVSLVIRLVRRMVIPCL